ncbi:MAG: filamentous hemagglutinin N-terminal domain-containing protein [Pegethrix bostrychoides GSE-TBD4-15B]|jgi:filamentous hemagglutinin family protein|uniref:Filamentous hemagglutinin N-terminal domain-containing protein n=1 Tax=Pegethrix bostrychoides GSE-TBD4-15B TaxID=2839662 RepID=A0A951P848_9CYAN|nr:filamentous hemagglutinin N-terminal domain-containing protein [Pegethrix bostrychoides GSE-TBD4-15B]
MQKVLWAALVGLTAVGVARTEAAVAQVRPDATLGAENSRVRADRVRGRDNIERDSDVIEGGAQRGGNLFHSFEQFDVPEGRGAYFNSPADVRNIFSRVTSADRSEIFGTLGTFSNANLFFMNPNGILFGANASLDLGGSFAATTANGIQFGEQGFFNATNPEAPALLTINPSAFLFNQIPTDNLPTITNQANTGFGLRVRNGQNLLLLGGNVANDGGQLSAFEGRVEIGAVVGIGAVGLNSDSSFNFPTDLIRGDVSFTNRSQVDVTFKNAGDIRVTARSIDVSGESLLKAGINTNSGAVGSRAGDLNLNATGDVQIRQGSRIENDVNPGAIGNGGNLTITARSLLVEERSQISASTFARLYPF